MNLNIDMNFRNEKKTKHPFLSSFLPLRSGSAPRPRAKHCQHSPGLVAHATTRVVSQMEYKKPAALCSLSLPATLRFSKY